MMQGEDGTHEVKSYPRANSLIGWLGEAKWSLPARQPCRLVGSVVAVLVLYRGTCRALNLILQLDASLCSIIITSGG